MIDFTAILTRRYGGAEWSLIGEDYENLEWLDDSKKPTKKQLEDQWESVQAEIETEKLNQANQREAVLAKLAILGLTVDDLRALGL